MDSWNRILQCFIILRVSECSSHKSVTRQPSFIMVHLPFDQHTKVYSFLEIKNFKVNKVFRFCCRLLCNPDSLLKTKLVKSCVIVWFRLKLVVFEKNAKGIHYEMYSHIRIMNKLAYIMKVA